MISLNETKKENERSYMMLWVCVHVDSASLFSRAIRQMPCMDPSSSPCFNIQSTLQTLLDVIVPMPDLQMFLQTGRIITD